jgi:hypothetical protein
MLAVAFNVVFWAALPAYGVEAPAWFVIAFDVLFVVPLFCLLPSMRPQLAGGTEAPPDAMSKWGSEGMGEFPGVDESRDRLHRAGWSVGEVASATRWLVCGWNGETRSRPKGRARRRHGGGLVSRRPRLGCWRR